MYCLTTLSGAPPTVATKYEPVHNDGSLRRREGNSSRKSFDDLPLASLMNFPTPYSRRGML